MHLDNKLRKMHFGNACESTVKHYLVKMSLFHQLFNIFYIPIVGYCLYCSLSSFLKMALPPVENSACYKQKNLRFFFSFKETFTSPWIYVPFSYKQIQISKRSLIVMCYSYNEFQSLFFTGWSQTLFSLFCCWPPICLRDTAFAENYKG